MSETTKGQSNRKIINERILVSLKKYTPNEYARLCNLLAFEFNLTPDTIRYRYVCMYIEVGILERDKTGKYFVSKLGEEKIKSYNNFNPPTEIKPEEEEPESFIEYAKKHPNPEDRFNEEEKPTFSLDLDNFIKVGHFEDLSKEKLVAILNTTIKNQKLKDNWIKQIEEKMK